MCFRRTLTFLTIAAAFLAGQASLYDSCVSVAISKVPQASFSSATPSCNLSQILTCLVGTTDDSQPALSCESAAVLHATCTMTSPATSTTATALQFHLQSRGNRLQV